MPFDLSGNFTRSYNYTQDRDNGIKILASRIDGEFDNFATAMNSVFFRNGIVPLSGNLDMGLNRIIDLADGSAASPAVKFGSDPNSGMYLDGSGILALSAAGGKRLAANSTGVAVSGILSATGAATFGSTVTVSASGIDVTGNSTFHNDVGLAAGLTVAGGTSLQSTTIANGLVITSSGLTVTGAVNLNNGLTIAGALNGASLSMSGNAGIGGTLSVTGTTSLGTLNMAGTLAVAGPTVLNSNVQLSINNQPLQFTDTSGSHPYFINQADNNFVFYGTDAAGNPRGIWSIVMRNSTSNLVINPPIQCNSSVAVSGALTAASLALATPLQVSQGGTSATTNTGTGAVVLQSDPALSGNPTAPTQAYGNASTRLATTAFVDKLLDLPRVTGGLQRGAVFATSAGFTVNSAAQDQTYMVYNDSAAAITITQGTATLRLHGTTSTGNRTLAARGFATIWFNAAAEAIIMGDVS
jgi:hypothetical protein